MPDQSGDHEFNQKLVETEEKWVLDGRGLTRPSSDSDKNRRPPGQHVTQDFPALDLGVQPI